MNKSKNKKTIFLLVTIVGLFLIQALYLVYFQFTNAKKLNEHELNARNSVDEDKYMRGTIFDRMAKKLTYSELENGVYVRKNLYRSLYSTVIGYSSKQYGKTNIEAKYNNELLNIKSASSDIFSKLDQMIASKDKGNDIYLTIDDRLQAYAYELMGENKGTIIVANPKTGEILTMLSKPSLNVKMIESNWEEIINSENAILINRATQGLYEPGSIFKIVTAMAMLKEGIDLNYNDTGEATIADYTVNNYGEKSNGKMDLEKALQVSSNTYFFEKSKEISNETFLSVLSDFGIGKTNDFPINLSKSKLPFKKGLSDLEKGMASFGQGESYLTPYDMLLVSMGIANDGKVMKPRIIDKIDRQGNIENVSDQVLSSKIDGKAAKQIREYLKSTAEYNDYTSKSGVSIAGKTGTAQTANKLNHLWFLGMAPADKPEYAIIVLVENQDDIAAKVAAPIAEKLVDYIYNNKIGK